MEGAQRYDGHYWSRTVVAPPLRLDTELGVEFELGYYGGSMCPCQGTVALLSSLLALGEQDLEWEKSVINAKHFKLLLTIVWAVGHVVFVQQSRGKFQSWATGGWHLGARHGAGQPYVEVLFFTKTALQCDDMPCYQP